MSDTIWFPSIQEYNPNISKEKWLEILDNRNLTSEQNLQILACMYNFGGEATCTQLSQKYGRTVNTYNSGSSNYAKNLVKAKICNAPPFRDNGDSRWWPVLFVGHEADKNTPGSYVWKLRDELKEACKEYDIEKWLNQKFCRKYWSGGIKWGNINKKEEFIDKNYWQIGWEKDDTSKGSKQAWENIKLVNIGDYLAFHSYGGQNDLTIHYLAEVKDVNKNEGLLVIEKLPDDNYYKGKGPKMPHGTWFGTLLQVTGSEAINKIFHIKTEENNMYNENINKYIKLLFENHNLILHGAPGTGKTYLAKQIAKAMNNSNLNLTVQGFESFISSPGYLDKHENSKDKETGTIQRYEKIAAKLLEKYHSFEYIADNADTLREEMQSERDETGKTDWDNNQIVVNHIKKYVEFAKEKNGTDSNDTIGFCQFHPSYDYTDFVEGLRPTKNNGFERKDGIFKSFCKKALQNAIDSNKSVTQIQTELSWQEKIKVFLDDAIENGTECPLKKNGCVIIESYHDDIVEISLPGNESHKGDTIHISKLLIVLSADQSFESAIEIERYLKGFHSAEYSYILAVYKKIREYSFDSKVTVNTASKVDHKNYIFIIDEINRGELSKIFGELFFSIDPGYRGEEGRVNTQYQNLIEDDLFKDGFYIPENVYIIGTMNDIDRSVESMDFAMRRRFIFEEVTAAESADNMQLSPDVKDRMKRINDQISKTEGLNSAYHIGGAYFRGVSDFEKIWNLKLSSLIKEYLRGMDDDDSKYKKIKNAYFNESETIVTNEEESSASIEE